MFPHLFIKTDYSLCKSTLSIKKLSNILESLEKKPEFLGMCDDNLYGAFEFASACTKYGVKPVIGVQLNVIDEKSTGIVNLHAMNETGYKNLLWLSSQQNSNKGVPIDLSLVFTRKEGVFMTVGGTGSIINACQTDKIEMVRNLAFEMGDNLALGLTRYGTAGEFECNDLIASLASDLEIPLCPIQYAHFGARDEWESADILMCVGEQKTQMNYDRTRVSPECFLKSEAEMEDAFDDVDGILENSYAIGQSCNFWPKPSKPILPVITSDEPDALREQSANGLKERLKLFGVAEGHTEEEYFKRLDFELDVIINMGFAGYFLIVADFIKWSFENGVAVGPGRGSGAGSIVAWALGITALDPIYYGLLFERFLNPDRVSMPDFDIDFCQTNRKKTIDYIVAKYGQENVASIITFGKMQARAVLKDVGRVMEVPYRAVDEICKMVPFNPVDPVTLEKAIKLDPALQDQINEGGDVARMIEVGLQLEGLNRHASTHAAGIIIADRPIVETAPVEFEEGSAIPIVGFHMKPAEAVGLVKFDFLGLKTLTMISNTLSLIKSQQGREVNLDTLEIDNKDTFEFLRRGKTRGIFQLDSLVCRDVMQRIGISSIHEIIALTSLNRPGPMENIPSYIARSNGVEEVKYPHPLLKDLLEETRGIIIYQEQVMKVAQILGGYTLAQADLLRRAMGKKIKSEMDKQKVMFADGAKDHGVPKKEAEEIFDLIEKFAGYGFNKSHAAAYSVISYHTAYLKTNYPLEFYTACLNIEIDDTSDLNLFISEAKSLGVKVSPPNVNLSGKVFTIHEGQIIYGLAALKSVGQGVAEMIVTEREANGPYKDVFDFCRRNSTKVVNKRTIESIAKSGGFRPIHPNAKQLVQNIDKLSGYVNAYLESANDESSLFGDSIVVKEPALPKMEDYNDPEKLTCELESIGFYLTHHPLESYKSIGDFVASTDVSDYIGSASEVKGKMVGVINIIKQRTGKRGRFAFIYVSDLESIYEACIFNETIITQKRHLIYEGSLVALSLGMQKQENGAPRLIVNDIVSLDEYDQDPSCLVMKGKRGGKKNDASKKDNPPPSPKEGLPKGGVPKANLSEKVSKPDTSTTNVVISDPLQFNGKTVVLPVDGNLKTVKNELLQLSENPEGCIIMLEHNGTVYSYRKNTRFTITEEILNRLG